MGGKFIWEGLYVVFLAKKEYSNLMLKLKENGKYVNWSDLNSLPQGAQGGREGTVLLVPGREELSTQFLSVNHIWGRQESVHHVFVHQPSNPFSVREEVVCHGACGSFMGLYPVTPLAFELCVARASHPCALCLQ